LKDKRKLSFITLTFFLVSIFYASKLPNVYTSHAILAPNIEDKSGPNLSSYSAIAGIAGIGLPSESYSKSQEAMERLKSLDFFTNQFLPYVKLENIFAVEDWNAITNKLKYDESLYNSSKNRWVRDAEPPYKSIPSNQEAYEIYRDIFSISEDKNTKFVTISISHKSPHIADSWLKIIIKNINESMRFFDQKKAENAIDFLNKEAEVTRFTELSEAIGQLLETQMQTLMLTSISDDYVFKTISSSYAPEEKSSPNRFSIIFFITILGFILGCFYSLATFVKNNKALND
jgi:LPS O-antigen subunit length determinant protein (WzzB/FepE family)